MRTWSTLFYGAIPTAAGVSATKSVLAGRRFQLLKVFCKTVAQAVLSSLARTYSRTIPSSARSPKTEASLRTLLLGFGSSAIDTGLDASCPNIDQRGMTRPQGPHCEIGAVESFLFRRRSRNRRALTPGKHDGPYPVRRNRQQSRWSFHISMRSCPTPQWIGRRVVGRRRLSTRRSPNYTGPDSFTYTATDINGTSVPGHGNDSSGRRRRRSPTRKVFSFRTIRQRT